MATESEARVETPITTRTLHRERSRASQRVAASIAEELRNPVLAITSAAQLLRYRNTDDPLTERNLGRILREAERLSGFVSALLDYGRPGPMRLSSGDPDDVWTEVLAAHRGQLESKALVVRHLRTPGRIACSIDREQLGTAFGNALSNAVDAAPEGSDLTIRSSVDADGTWRSRLHNDGAPIAADILPGAFDPLVTTKPGHAGVGLAIAQRVISEHGGTIALTSPDSNAGAAPANAVAGSPSGTTISFSLPPARQP